MIYRSKAPLRIGLAGGGTDVSPYSDLYGGAILNATVSLYAHATIEPTDEPQIVLRALDRNQTLRYELQSELPIDGVLDLHKGIYNHVVSQFGPIESGFSLNTFVDAPAGSGLGSSSTLVVAILGAFAQWLRLRSEVTTSRSGPIGSSATSWAWPEASRTNTPPLSEDSTIWSSTTTA